MADTSIIVAAKNCALRCSITLDNKKKQEVLGGGEVDVFVLCGLAGAFCCVYGSSLLC